MTYQYLSGSTNHRVSADGLEAGLGRLFSVGDVQASVFLSATVRDTNISPADSSNAMAGTKLDAMLSGDLTIPIMPTLMSNIGYSYSPANDAYWLRLRLARDMGSYWLGPEVATFGDNTYAVSQLGLAVTKIRLGSLEFGIKSGIRKERDISAKPYAGVELSGLF